MPCKICRAPGPEFCPRCKSEIDEYVRVLVAEIEYRLIQECISEVERVQLINYIRKQVMA